MWQVLDRYDQVYMQYWTGTIRYATRYGTVFSSIEQVWYEQYGTR